MRYRLTFDGYADNGTPKFRVVDGRGGPVPVAVGLASDAEAGLSDIRSRTREFAADGFQRALTAYAVRKIESAVRIDGPEALAAFRSGAGVEIELSELEMLAEQAGEKRCGYQHREQREMYCAASDDEDQLGAVRVGLRWLAPTTSTVCAHCDLPDEDSICSHLVHPNVVGLLDNDFFQRTPTSARCDLRQPNVANGVRCKPGGHDCWVRTISVPVARRADLDRSPVAFSEALHFLNVVWTLKFGKARPLVQSRDGTAHARIAQGAHDRDEFRARLSDIADVLKAIAIPDDMLPDGSRGESGQFLRVRKCLEAKLADATDSGRLARAIKTLQCVNDLRTDGQHSGAVDTLRRGLTGLGVRYPPEQWSELWTEVRAIAADALTEIRRLVEQVPD